MIKKLLLKSNVFLFLLSFSLVSFFSCSNTTLDNTSEFTVGIPTDFLQRSASSQSEYKIICKLSGAIDYTEIKKVSKNQKNIDFAFTNIPLNKTVYIQIDIYELFNTINGINEELIYTGKSEATLTYSNSTTVNNYIVVNLHKVGENTSEQNDDEELKDYDMRIRYQINSDSSYQLKENATLTFGEIGVDSVEAQKITLTVQSLGTQKIKSFEIIQSDSELLKITPTVYLTYSKYELIFDNEKINVDEISTETITIKGKNADEQEVIDLSFNLSINKLPNQKLWDCAYLDGTVSTEYDENKTLLGIVVSIKNDRATKICSVFPATVAFCTEDALGYNINLQTTSTEGRDNYKQIQKVLRETYGYDDLDEEGKYPAYDYAKTLPTRLGNGKKIEWYIPSSSEANIINSNIRDKKPTEITSFASFLGYYELIPLPEKTNDFYFVYPLSSTQDDTCDNTQIIYMIGSNTERNKNKSWISNNSGESNTTSCYFFATWNNN